MFIKLPSGRIFQVNTIISCKWTDDKKELHVFTGVDNQGEYWILKEEDAKRLYEYLESIAIV